MKIILSPILLIATLLIFNYCFAQSKSITLFGNNPNAGNTLNIRGFNMYYETYGSGKPLLIIHGNGGSIKDFENQIPFFSKEFKIIIADNRAQGKSRDPGDSLSYEMMADDLNGLLDHLHLDSCYVLGWSDGGIDGLLLAMRHPDKVKKLAISGANLWPDTTAVDPFVYKWARDQFQSLKNMKQTPTIKNKLKLANLLTNEPHISISDLNKVLCPALVIGGDHDILLPQHTLLIASSIRKSYLWIVPNSGHSAAIYYKDQFNKVVSDFFNKPYREIKEFGRFR